MSMIKISGLDFDQVDDPIKTEETIFHQLKNSNLRVPMVAFPIAYSINRLGISQTQKIIEEIEKKEKYTKVYVCQHILVRELNFGDNIVFTPHVIEGEKYNFIPHYNPIFHLKDNFTKTSLRKHEFSFMGDFNTNQVRSEIGAKLSNKIPVQQIGKWFFSHDAKTQHSLKSVYKNLIENTKFPLCPQGTGPSTLRFFESLSSGGFPVIFNNLKIPEDIKKFVIKSSIEEILTEEINIKTNQFDDNLQEEMLDIYWSKYSNDNLSRSIIEKLEKI